MQVSEWREGRVLSLDTAAQSIAVEPWGHTIAPQRNGQVRLRMRDDSAPDSDACMPVTYAVHCTRPKRSNPAPYDAKKVTGTYHTGAVWGRLQLYCL